MRALLSVADAVFGGGTPTSTGTALVGAPATAAANADLLDFWEAPPGGPHTWQLTWSGLRTIAVVCLVAPPGQSFATSPTVRLRATAGGTILYASAVSARPPVGLPDRRFYMMPAAVSARQIEVVAASGTRIARVWAGDVLDLSRYTGRARGITVAGNARLHAQTTPEVFHLDLDATDPRQWLRISSPLAGVPDPTVDEICRVFERVGRTEPLVWLPHGYVDSAIAAQVELTHATGIYGVFAADLEWTRTGSTTTFTHQDFSFTGDIYSGAMTFEGI